MCEYLNDNKCRVSHEICPYVYFCSKTNGYRPSVNMPRDCKVKTKLEIPKGYCQVVHEHKGYLFIDYKGNGIQAKNPFNEVPLYVKVRKSKNGQYIISL